MQWGIGGGWIPFSEPSSLDACQPGWMQYGQNRRKGNKNKLCSMTCGRALQKDQGRLSFTMISEWGVTPPPLLQGDSKNTRWLISHYDFRMGCEPPPHSTTGWFKKYKVVYLPL